MGLITKEVEVLLHGNTIKYYENLGYEIPREKDKTNKMVVKKGSTIIVNVEDLPENSHVIIGVECDGCLKHYGMIYANYKKCNHNGSVYCQNCKSKILQSGTKHWNYNIALSDSERIDNRKYPQYIEFIKRVLARDNYTCQCCGKVSYGNMEVHHLDGYDWCVEKRTDDTNGVSLCSMCHKAFHTKFGYGSNTKQQYEKWIGHAIEDLKRYNGELPTARKIFDYEENQEYNSVDEYCKTHKCDRGNVYNCCNHYVSLRKYKDKNGVTKTCMVRVNTVKGHHLFWLDEYKKESESSIGDFV